MKTIKNQKPISLDVHLKYRCPNTDCGLDHWLSLKEAQQKYFKIVCDCGCVFSPKVIKKTKILYRTKRKKETVVNNANVQKQEKIVDVPLEILEKASGMLQVYGYTRSEASDLIKKSYAKNKLEDATALVKQVLSSLEIK